MSTALANAAWPACLSALRLDRFLAGELPPADADEVRNHVAGCARCAAAVSGLEAARDAVTLPPLRAVEAAIDDAPAGPAPVLRLSRRRRVLSVTLGGLAAAAGLAVVLRGGPLEPPEDARRKGSGVPGAAAWGAWVLHDGAVRRAGPGEVVAPGDALRFAVTAPAPGYVAVLSLDAAGRATVYYPAGGRAEPVASGAEVALPLATKLDATVGEERLFALYCERPVELEPLRAALEGAGRLEAGAAPGGQAAPAPAGCQVTGWRFEKR
jgi:hypothetical protein